jgi:hypothetical protein
MMYFKYRSLSERLILGLSPEDKLLFETLGIVKKNRTVLILPIPIQFPKRHFKDGMTRGLFTTIKTVYWYRPETVLHLQMLYQN